MTVGRLGFAWLVMVTVGTTLLTLGAGLCLFHGAHGDADNHGMSFDLCLGMATVSVALPFLAPLPEAGRALATTPSGVAAISPSVPAPPPKFTAA